VQDQGHVLLLDEHSCPRLFVRVRDADPSRPIFSRTTRVDEVQETACKAEPGGAFGARSTFAMGFDASYAISQTDERRGEYSVDVSALAEIDGQYLLVGTTDKLHLSMVDDKFIRRNWGAAVEGATISLTLDKDAYELGDDIPFHIALGNIDSHATFTSMDPYMDFPGLTLLELESSDGQPIPKGFSGMWMMGHGFCHRFVSGLVFPLEVTLDNMGFHPNRPGVYTVVAIWTPFKGACPDEFRRARSPEAPAEHLTVRSSPVTFRLVPK
jgi:hypothetical protein